MRPAEMRRPTLTPNLTPEAMNILFFSEQSPFLSNRVGGAENSMRLIAEGLAARGHRVRFASLRPDALPFARRFAVNGVEVGLCANPRRSLLRRLAARLPGGTGRLGARLDARGWARVRRAVFGPKGAPQPDLLYGFYEMEFLAQALAARDAAGGRPAIVMRMAGLGWHDAIRRGLTTAAECARIFNGVDAINYLAEASRAQIEARAAEIGLPLAPRSAFVADIGVAVGTVPLSWAGPSAGPGLDILVATRFAAPQKRQDLLIEAVGLLRDRLPVKVVMIGTGASREAAVRRRDALGLGEIIEIRPFLPQEALWARMRTADLLCHPCDHEGVSKIILEAMMLGLPVLASDVPPLPDYVIEGETGYRVANTPEAWAARLVEIAASKHRLPALSAGARGFVEATYDTARNVSRYEAAFRALAGTGGIGAGAAARPDAAGDGSPGHAQPGHAQ